MLTYVLCYVFVYNSLHEPENCYDIYFLFIIKFKLVYHTIMLEFNLE